MKTTDPYSDTRNAKHTRQVAGAMLDHATNGANGKHETEKLLKRAMFCGSQEWIERVYAKERQAKVAALTSLYPHVIDLKNFDEHGENLRDVEVMFSTWGIPSFTEEHLDRLPSLRAVFYAGGTVRGFAERYIQRNIQVVSAWRANAVPVAEFTLGQILLSTKGYFRNTRHYTSPAYRRSAFQGLGTFGETVAVLGAGAIGSLVIELLKPFHLRVVVYDPFLSAQRAAQLGVERVSLETAFAEGYVVSNHLADLPETRNLLRGDLFRRMRTDATFINTGRGGTVDEPAFVSVLRDRPDLVALLDVTSPEPPVANSLLYTLPNVFLSTHIAGSINDELVRMADYCIEDFIAYASSRPLRHAVSLAMLETMA